VIGQNVPFVTGQFTNTGNSTTVQPVPDHRAQGRGPHAAKSSRRSARAAPSSMAILPGGVERAGLQPSNATNGPDHQQAHHRIQRWWSTTARIVVLGGLLEDEYVGSQEQGAGSWRHAPVLARCSSSETRTRKKTNLMVFLRPVVMRDAAATERLSLDRYDHDALQQKEAQPVPNELVPINEVPVLLPPRCPRPPPGTALPKP